MNEDVKQEWLSALRSEDYTQGIGELKTANNEFCCLGVLCDLAVKAEVAHWENTKAYGWVLVPSGKTVEEAKKENNLGTAVLPGFVMDWAGIDAVNPKVRYVFNEDIGRENVPLSTLNDSRAATFEQIADAIERDL